MPINITSNGNLFGLNLGSQYPNVSGDAYTGTRSQWLNPAAFVRPADGEWGTLSRDALRLPHITNVDINITAEELRVQRRAKLDVPRRVLKSCFNHTQVWGINTGFSGDNPGERHLHHRQRVRPTQRLARCPDPASWQLFAPGLLT